MAADTVTNSEDKVSSKSGRVAVEGSTAMMTMVQSVSKCEGKVECSLVSSYRDAKALKILKPAERKSFQRICKEKSRKSRDTSDCKSPSQCFGTEKRKAEADALHFSPVNDTNSGNTREGSPLPNGTPPESIPSISNSEYHVLAVDDNIVDRTVIEKFLKASSYKVTTVNSALRALEYLGLSETCSTSLEPNKVAVDLIITDYCMPGMTGYELLKIVKSDTSVCKEIPVIVMSSEGDSNRINRCLAEGAGAYIIKPVKMEDVKRLRDHIRSSASSSESCESSNSSIGAKRKSPDGVQLHPEKRPRTAESLVS